mgnify:FL=1
MKYAERLKSLRLENELTQSELAKKANLATSCIAMIESGKREPSAHTVVSLANALNVTTDYLPGLEDEFGIPIFTPEEKTAGISATKKISITPIEEDMLDVFRKVGKTRGESAQRAIIEMVEKML